MLPNVPAELVHFVDHERFDGELEPRGTILVFQDLDYHAFHESPYIEEMRALIKKGHIDLKGLKDEKSWFVEALDVSGNRDKLMDRMGEVAQESQKLRRQLYVPQHDRPEGRW